MMNKQAAIGLVVLLVLAAALYAVFVSREGGTGREAGDLRDAAERLGTAPKVSVPTTENPIKQVLPTENPLEKANPFNKAYMNPFE